MYSPFDKDLPEITAEDLEGLKRIHEGWYVDYKEQQLSPRNYAKAISAMANTYGGWIFIGVKELSRDDNRAGSFPGVDAGQIDLTHQHIRQGVAEHLNPQPFFETRTIDCPNATNDEKVVVVRVPQSSRAPIVHKDGRIYRRVGDASEPVPETRREVVEHLVERSKRLENKYRKWHKKDPELSEGESDYSYLRILAVPDYWDEHDIWLTEDIQGLRDLISEPAPNLSFSTPYQTIYSSLTGIVCRSVTGPDPNLLRTTLKVSRRLKNEIWIPIPTFPIGSPDNYLSIHPELEELVLYAQDQGYSNCHGLGLDMVFGAIDGFFAMQRRLETHASYTGDTLFKFKLCNVWRHIPLMAESIERLNWTKSGVPMILNKDLTVVPGGKPEHFIQENLHKIPIEKENSHFMLSASFFICFLNTVGLQVGNKEDLKELIADTTMRVYKKAEQVSIPPKGD